MFKILWESIRNFFANQMERIRYINNKYAKPRIKMTPLVSVSLLFLRLYLFALVGILVYKFFTLLKH
jgi:hypothetical protein